MWRYTPSSVLIILRRSESKLLALNLSLFGLNFTLLWNPEINKPGRPHGTVSQNTTGEGRPIKKTLWRWIYKPSDKAEPIRFLLPVEQGNRSLSQLVPVPTLDIEEMMGCGECIKKQRNLYHWEKPLPLFFFLLKQRCHPLVIKTATSAASALISLAAARLVVASCIPFSKKWTKKVGTL